MASRPHSTTFRPQLPPHCIPTSSFLYRISLLFGACLPTPLAFTSTLMGCLSILSWLFAQMPQIYTNHKIKSAAGLSIYFLIEWLLGDLTNLLGALFTNQATWQVVIASYYVFVDTCLLIQFFWYTHILPRWREESIYSSGSETDFDASSDLINSLSPINSNFGDDIPDLAKDMDEETLNPPKTQPVTTPHFSNTNYEKRTTESPASSMPKQWIGPDWNGPSPRTVMYAATLSALVTQTRAAPFQSDDASHILQTSASLEFAGTILSWTSTALYLGSRLPQLYQNWRRKSTAGLSPYMFLAAFSGNFFYSASMLTNPNAWYDLGPYGGHGWVDKNGSKRGSWILNAAPFFLGAFGVLIFDATMGVQFLMYRDQQEKLVKVRDRRGFSRWQKVNGWIRGWIPTLKKERIVDLSESQRLLSESRDLDRRNRRSYNGGT